MTDKMTIFRPAAVKRLITPKFYLFYFVMHVNSRIIIMIIITCSPVVLLSLIIYIVYKRSFNNILFYNNQNILTLSLRFFQIYIKLASKTNIFTIFLILKLIFNQLNLIKHGTRDYQNEYYYTYRNKKYEGIVFC